MNDSADMLELGDVGPSLPEQPYPGLRPFTRDEWRIFFGRESMTQDVISRLLSNQFVAVHGDSGCGKSSLIAAGVMPFLEHDQARAGGSWTTTIMRPEDNPVGNLARALAGRDGEADPSKVLDIRRLLNRGSDAPAAVAAHLGCNAANNVCILLDQFEELFEHARRGGETDAALITSFLVGLARAKPKGLHAILTMRSDYLGQCAHYRGFAETVNQTQYLVPRMERPALLRAIREPGALFGGWVEPDLAARLIADAGMGQDQLPLIQHGLMLMWRKHAGKGVPPALTMADYSAGGSLADQLSRHADEVMHEAIKAPDEERIVEALFRALTDRNSEGLAIRRRQGLPELVAITGASRETLVRIIDRFRAPDASFLRPFGQAPLQDEDEIDISHEAFIRNWRKISEPGSGWLDREANDGLIWTSLRIAASAFQENPEARLSHAASVERERWLKGRNEAWAIRHGGHWAEVSNLIAASGNVARAAMRRGRVIFFGAIAAAVVFAVVAVSAGLLALKMRDLYDDQARLTELADQRTAEAAAATKRAEDAAAEAQKQTLAAETKAAEARSNQTLSLAALGRVQLFDSNPMEATQLALAAWPRVGDDKREALRIAHNTIVEALPTLGEQRRLRHPSAVSSVKFSRDGKRIVTGSRDGMVRVWDAKTGLGLLTLPGESALVAIAISPDGKLIAAASLDSTPEILDANSGAHVWSLTGHTDAATSLAFSPDGQRLVTGSVDGTARVWDMRTGTEELKLTASTGTTNAGAVRAVAFSPTGTRIVTGGDDAAARVWDAFSGSLLDEHKDTTWAIWGVAFSTDGRIATASSDWAARIWTGKTMTMMSGHTNAATGVAFSPDGSRLVTSSSDRSTRVWDATTGAQLYTLGMHSREINAIDFAPNGDEVVTGSEDGTARVWKLVRFDAQRVLKGHQSDIWGLDYAPDGKTVITASSDKSVHIWDADTGVDLRQVGTHAADVWGVAYSPDGTHVATSSFDKTVRIWSLVDDSPPVDLIGHTDSVTKVVFTPDGSKVVTTSWDGTVRMWNVADGSQVYNIAGFPDRMLAVAFSGDGLRFVTGGHNDVVRIWDSATGAELMRSAQIGATVYGADFSPDGRRAVITVGRVAQVLDTSASKKDGETVAAATILFDLKGHYENLNAVAFSPDGKRIATASNDKTVGIWDAATGGRIAVLGGHSAAVTTVVFSPDGTHLVTASQDKTARIWDLSGIDTGDAIEIACKRLGSNTDLGELERQYNLPTLVPICGNNAPSPFDFSALR